VSPLHQELAAGRWQTLSLFEQLANVGGEVELALDWVAKGNSEHSLRALCPGGSTEGNWRSYFRPYGLAAAIKREPAC